MRLHGAEFQLVQGKLIGKPSILATQGEGGKINHNSQHHRTKQIVLKTPTGRNWDNMSTRISSIRKETRNRRNRTRLLVLLALLQ